MQNGSRSISTKKAPKNRELFGGNEGARTLDLLDVNEAL